MKVYFDGSHYIGIPYTERPKKEKVKKEEIIEQDENMAVISPLQEGEFEAVFGEETASDGGENEENSKKAKIEPLSSQNIEQSLEELFEELYLKSTGKKRSLQRDYIIKHMLNRFNSLEVAEKFIDEKLEKKLRNLICRRIRLARKLYLNEFNYFVTFTYDDKLHTEDSFKSRLRKCLSNFASRKDWKYAGVWERSPKLNRLHFHGIFDIPTGTMPGELFEENDYNFKLHRRKKTTSNTFFKKKFGRCDFDKIETPALKGEAMRYLMKYIEKSGEKIVYSRGLARYIVSDIIDDDIICSCDEYDSKFILYDNFSCIKEGEFLGEISSDLINRMPKIV